MHLTRHCPETHGNTFLFLRHRHVAARHSRPHVLAALARAPGEHQAVWGPARLGTAFACCTARCCRTLPATLQHCTCSSMPLLPSTAQRLHASLFCHHLACHTRCAPSALSALLALSAPSAPLALSAARRDACPGARKHSLSDTPSRHAGATRQRTLQALAWESLCTGAHASRRGTAGGMNPTGTWPW